MRCGCHALWLSFQYGFRLNQHVQVIGPIIIFPRSVFSWNVEVVEAITADSLMIFGVIEPRIETLIIGTGADETSMKISTNLLELARKLKINVEILSTQLVSFACKWRLLGFRKSERSCIVYF